MAENTTPQTPGVVVPEDNTYLNYGPELYNVPDQPVYRDYSIQIPNIQSSYNAVQPVDEFANIFNSALSKKNYEQFGAEQYFPAESMMFDKYASSWDFADKGFIPWRNQEDLYNQDTNVFKELYRSSQFAAPLFFDGFTSGLRSMPDLVSGAFTGDWDTVFRTDDAVAEKWGRATKMGASTAGGVSSFITNLEISAAHMLGTVIEMVAENALLGYVTAQSGGAAAPATVPVMGTKFTRAFKTVVDGFRNIYKVADVFSDANAARSVYQGALKNGINLAKFINPLENITELGWSVYKGEQSLSAAKSFGSFYRDIREINFALSEAKLEGGFQYHQLKDQLTQEYVNENGYLPQGDLAKRINDSARESGDFTTKFNLPVIYYSNRIGFGNLFKGNDPISKLMTEAGESSLFRSVKFNASKDLFEAVGQYNVKNAFRYGLGNSLNYFKANIMEGIQENLQETIGGASYDYYYKRFYNPSYGGMNLMLGDLSVNLGKQASGQGLSTFLSGAVMGLIPAGGMRALRGIENLTYKYIDRAGYDAFKQKREETLKNYVTKLNEVYKDPLKFFDPELLNAARQGELSKYLTQASLNKNDKQFYDIKDQQVFDHLMTVLRSGKLGLFKDKIAEFKNLQGDELKAALGFDIEDASKLNDRLDQVLQRADQLQQRFDAAQEKLPNRVNLKAFKKGTKEYEEAAIQFMAFENAREQSIFLGYSFDRTAERMVDILNRYKNIKMTAKSNFIDVSVATSPQLYNNEIDILEKEIETYEQGDEDSKKIAALKKKRLQTLKKWKNAVESPGGNPLTVKVTTPAITPDGGVYPVDYPSIANPAYQNYRNLAKLAFEELVAVEADAVKDSAYRDGVDQGFDLVMDYLELAKEQDRLTQAINILADPNNFLSLYNGHYSFLKDIYAKREQIIRDSIERALKVTDENDLVYKLLNLKHPEGPGVGYIEDPENPGSYFKVVDNALVVVQPGSADEALIKQVIDDHNKATETALKKKEAEKKEAERKAAEAQKKKDEEAAKKKAGEEKPAEKKTGAATYSADQSYYNSAHGVAPKEVEYTINYNPNGSIQSVSWNYKGSSTVNLEKSVSTEAEFKQLMDLRIGIDYFKSLLAGKMSRKNIKYDKNEDLHTGYFDSIIINPDAFTLPIGADAETLEQISTNLSVDNFDKVAYDSAVKSIKDTLSGFISELEKQYAAKQNAFVSTKRASDPKFISSIVNTIKVYVPKEAEAAMREAVLSLTPDQIKSRATVKLVRGESKPKQVFSKNDGKYKVFRQNPPISSELYIDGKLVGYPTYHDIYTFEINGVIKTAGELTKSEYNIFANPEAGSYEDFKVNYASSKAVYDALSVLIGDKQSANVSNEELSKILVLTPRQGDFVFTDTDVLLKDLEETTGAELLAIIDKTSVDDFIVKGTTATEVAENRNKVKEQLAKINFAEKTKNQGRYIALYQLKNGNVALIEMSSGYLASDEIDELFADIKSELENTFVKNVSVDAKGKREAKNADFTRDFDKSLDQRLFIAIPQGVSDANYSVKMQLTAAADLRLTFDNFKDKNYTVYVTIPFDKSGKSSIKGMNDLISRVNQAIDAYNTQFGTQLPIIKTDYFKNSISPNANFTELSSLYTNVSPEIYQNTSMLFGPTSTVAKDVAPASPLTKAKRTKFFPTIPAEQAIITKGSPEEVTKEDLTAEELKEAKTKKESVNAPKADGTVKKTALSDIKDKYDILKTELTKKYTDEDGNITNIVSYNEELSKLSKEEENAKNKLTASKKKPVLKIADQQYYDEKDVADLGTFKLWMQNVLPEIFTVEEVEGIVDRLSENKVVLGRFYAYIKAVNDGSSKKVNGVIQTSADAAFKYHEAFHGVFRLLLTEEQVQRMLSLGRYELVQQLRNEGLTIEERLKTFRTEHPSYAELNEGELEDRLIEEYLADKFDAYKMNQIKDSKTLIGRIFSKIRRFIDRILGRRTEILQLFEDIDRGKFKSANVQNNRYTKELLNVPYIQAFKIAYGYDVIADVQGNEIQVKKYLSESDTNRIVSSVVNSFLQRTERLVEFNKNKLLDEILNDYQKLYQFGRYKDVKMSVEKNARLRTFNQVFTNPEARENIKQNVNNFLNMLGFNQELQDDEMDSLIDDVGDRKTTDQYNDSFNQGGYKSLSKYLRQYIQATAKEQGDEFGNEILDPETDEKIFMGVNAGIVYNGLVKVMSGVTTEEKFIKRLLSFRTGNSDSAAFINKFIEDTGLEYNEEYDEWRITQNPRLFNSVFKAFTLFRVDYEDLIIDPKKKQAFFVRANSKDAASNQFNRWKTDFEFNYQDRYSEQKRKDLTAVLSSLNDLLRLDVTVSDEELAQKETDLVILEKLSGIKISSVFYNYSVAKALLARKKELTLKQQELISAFDGIAPIAPDDFSQLIITLNKKENPFITFDEFVKDNTSDFDGEDMFNDEGEFQEDEVTEEEEAKITTDLEKARNKGNRSRLMRIAESNSVFDETVLSSSFENAEGETVTSHQYPTFHLAYLEDVIKNRSELMKLVESDPHIADSYLGQQILNNGDFVKILDRLKISRVGGLRQISSKLTPDGKIVEDKRRQVNKREGVVYGKFKDREFITSLLSMYLLKEEQIPVVNPEAKSGFDYITTTRSLIRVIEAKNTGDTINLPVIKAVYGKGDATKLTDEAKEAFLKEFYSEYNRITKVNSEDNTDNVIRDYNDFDNPGSKLRGLKFRSFADILGSKAEAYEQRAMSDDPTLTADEENEVLYLIEKYVLGDPEQGVRGLVDEFIDTLEIAGVISKTEKDGKVTYQNEMLPVELYGKVLQKPTARMTRLNLVNNFRTNMAQVFINDYINTMSFNKLYYGDQASTLKDFIDSVKRAAGSSAHGYNFRSSVLAPELGINEVYTNSFVTLHDDPKFIGNYSKKEQDRADAQTWYTTKGFRYNQFALGRLDQLKANILDKIDRGEKLTPEEVFGVNGTIRNNGQLKVEKIVYFDGKMYIKTSAFILTKEYTSILKPESKLLLERLKVTADQSIIDRFLRDNNNWVARPGMEALHNKRVELEDYEERNKTVAYSIPISAAKMLKVNVSSDLETFKVSDNHYYKLDNRYMRLQVENPTNKKVITDSTQGMQIIDTEQSDKTNVVFRGKKTNIKKVKDVYQTAVSQKIKTSYINARNEIFDIGAARNQFIISIKEGKISPKLGNFQRHAVEVLKKSGASTQLIEFFDVTEDPETGEFIPKYDLNHPYTKNKYEELFLSYFRKGVLSQQVPGHALTLVSDFGVKKLKRATVVKDGKPVAWEVITDAEYDAGINIQGSIKDLAKDEVKKGDLFLDELRHNVPVVDENGNPIPGELPFSEFMMPAHFREFMELQPGQKLPDEILRAYGIRTPAQDAHSMIGLKLVDFMPAFYGSLAVFPKELIEISGADFDVDKLYTHIADFYTKSKYNKDTRKWSTEFVPYGYDAGNAFYEYVLWNAKNNKPLKDSIFDLKEQDERYQGILTMLDDLYSVRKKIYSEADLYKETLNNLADTEWLLNLIAEDPTYDFTVSIDEDVMNEEEYLKARSIGATFVKDQILKLNDSIAELNAELNKKTKNISVISKYMRSLKTEKNRLDRFILFDAMEKMNMPVTKAAYETLTKKRGELNIGRLNNLILDSKYALLTNDFKTKTGIAFEPASESPLEILEQDEDLKKGINQEINMDNDHLLGKTVAQRNNKEGQVNVGAAVNAMMAYTLLHKHKIEILTEEPQEGKPSKIYSLVIDGVTFDNYANSRTAIIENGRVVSKFTGNRIFNTISAIITAMTDNAKNRRAAKFNMNINAVGLVSDLISRGVPEKLAVGMILNPTVKEYYRRVMEKRYRVQTKYLPSRKAIGEDIILDLVKQLGGEENVEIKPLTSKIILEAINNPTPENQLIVFANFLNIEKQNFAFSSVAQLMKVVKGPGTELAEWENLQERAKDNLGFGMTDEEFKKAGIPFDVRNLFDGDNKIMTAYWEANTQLNDELAKTMFITKSKLFKQVFNATYNQFDVPYYLKEVVSSKLKNNITLFFGLKAYLKGLRDRGDDLALLLNNNLVYSVDPNVDDIVKIVNYGRSILPKNYLLNRYINVIPQGKVKDGKLLLNQDNRKGISHLNPSSWGKLDSYQLEKLQNSFIELYSDERTRSVALGLFAYTIVKDGTMFRSDGLMRVFPTFMFDELIGEVMFNIRNMFAQDTLDRYEEDGDRHEAFLSVFGTGFKDIVEEFIKIYTPHITNKFYLKSVAIGDVEKGDVGKPIRYAIKKDGKNDSSKIIIDLFTDVKRKTFKTTVMEGTLDNPIEIEVEEVKRGKMDSEEKAPLVANINALKRKGFQIKSFAPGKLGINLPYIFKTKDSIYVLQSISTVKSNDEYEDTPLSKMFNKQYEFIAPRGIYTKIQLKGVNSQVPIAELFGDVPTAEFVRKYWRGVEIRDYSKAPTISTNEAPPALTQEELEAMDRMGPATSTAVAETLPTEMEYAEDITSPDGISSVPNLEEQEVPQEQATVKTQLENLGYTVSIKNKVISVMKGGTVQNLTNETPSEFLERIKSEEPKKAKKGSKKKFPKVADKDATITRGDESDIDPNDLTKDDFTC